MPLYFFNSALVTAVTVVATIFLALMFSYATARMKWRFAHVSRIYLLVGMFIPAQIVLLPIMIMERNLHIQSSYLAVIIPYVGFQLSFATLVFYGFMRSIPYELEESASIDGANTYLTFFRIIVPITMPAIATVAIFIFLFAWNEFLIALVMISKSSLQTIPLGLLNFSGQFTTDWGGKGAAMVIATLPTILVYFFFSEKVEQAMTVGAAVKG
ncbi:carbohydrate ABC transporter permease [Paenibacillus psychroresistens]|nr:carbohydrate ABC transporter permease [Paenibacillus psychroresistens]